MKSLRIAVQGCCHGELDRIYSSIRSPVDLLIITGDFQAIRNPTDLQTMNVPPKYKQLGQFHKYYQGQKKAPVLTIFIGGNHESSSYLQELRFGGWVAPNIYYLGEFGVIWYKGLRIGGISGIFNNITFSRDTNETLPYNDNEIRSVYHVKPKTYAKMMLMKDQQGIDIGLSHDWPQFIYNYGNLSQLLRLKPFFKQDVESGKLGSPLARKLLNRLKPKYWFSSHLHVLFEAEVQEINTNDNTDEINLDMDIDSSPKSTRTKFLALDKCGKNRKHLRVMNIPVNENHISSKTNKLYYDNRAIAVNKVVEATEKLNINEYDLDNEQFELLNEQIKNELTNLIDFYTVPYNFETIAPGGHSKTTLKYWVNNQTLDYVKKFGIDYQEPHTKT